jgi:uncharacterized damage-inducible protein DinB
MRTHDHYAFMGRYNRWFNVRLYDAAARLDDAQRKRDLGAFFGSIHGTLNHLLLADRIWLGRFARQGSFPMLADELIALPPVTGLDMQLHEDFGALRADRERLDAAIEAFAAALPAAFLDSPLHYTTTKGVARCLPMWQALSHFFNHQTHHRGQVTTLLMQSGIDPGVTDLLALADAC